MEKRLLLALIGIIFLLSSCKISDTTPKTTPSSTMNVTGEASNVTEWHSDGGAFRQKYISTDVRYTSVFTHSNDTYTAELLFEGMVPTSYIIRMNGAEIIYTTEHSNAYAFADSSDEGIWILEYYYENNEANYELMLISFVGELIRTVSLDEICSSDDSVSGIRYGSDRLFVQVNGTTVVADTQGRKLNEFNITEGNTSIAFGNEGSAYLVVYLREAVEIHLISDAELKLVCDIPTNNARISSGDADHWLMLSDGVGMFGLGKDGSVTPILIWSDCGINTYDTIRVIALPDGEYVCLNSMGISLLLPVEPSDLVLEKTQVSLATIGEYGGMSKAIFNFGLQNEDYEIIIKDYTEGGAIDISTAKAQLNLDIANGNHPDLIMFSDLSPMVYIKKEYLVDLNSLIEKDTDISWDEIIIAKQLETNGGLYYLGNNFTMDTLVGLHSIFGDSTGWTLDDYIERERALPRNTDTMYSITKPYLFNLLASRYIDTAVDWDEITCDFNNSGFIAMLNAITKIRENPEPTSSSMINTTLGPARLSEGSLLLDAVYINEVWSLAFCENVAGMPISYIGWPTVDGGNGTSINVFNPIGISAHSNNLEGAWAFLKYMVTDTEQLQNLPVYKPFFDDAVERALNTESAFGLQMTHEQSNRLYDLIKRVDSATISYDDTIMAIIDEEAAGFFFGTKSAEQTAEIIQSRVQLYLSEQLN